MQSESATAMNSSLLVSYKGMHPLALADAINGYNLITPQELRGDCVYIMRGSASKGNKKLKGYGDLI